MDTFFIIALLLVVSFNVYMLCERSYLINAVQRFDAIAELLQRHADRISALEATASDVSHDANVPTSTTTKETK